MCHLKCPHRSPPAIFSFYYSILMFLNPILISFFPPPFWILGIQPGFLKRTVAFGLCTRLEEWVVGRVKPHSMELCNYAGESIDLPLLTEMKVSVMISQVCPIFKTWKVLLTSSNTDFLHLETCSWKTFNFSDNFQDFQIISYNFPRFSNDSTCQKKGIYCLDSLFFVFVILLVNSLGCLADHSLTEACGW